MVYVPVRSKLMRLEDTICIHLFERSQFKLNQAIYTPDAIPIPNFSGSFFQYLFIKTEEVHASAGRYLDPEEHPFFIRDTTSIIPRRKDQVNFKPMVNLNNVILEEYEILLPNLCELGDDNKYGSATVCDINCLQAISRRVHLGEQVAETKYLHDKEIYDRLIKAEDTEAIRSKLRDLVVEQKVLERIDKKAEKYQIPGNIIRKFYEEKVMPLTIQAEIKYFLGKKND